jgi:uncharacterized protein
VTVFVDTSAFYALLVQTEGEHESVAKAFGSILDARRPLITSNYVLIETVSLLQHRFGLEAVRDFDSRIGPLLRIRSIDPEMHRRAMDRLLRADRRGLSLVDCSSFVVMDSEGIRQALALDADFGEQGYEVLPAD